MHKKLYKVKKNWVVGLIAGSILVFGPAIGVKADENVNSENIQRTVDQSFDNNQQWISQKIANNQNVGYINPTDENKMEQNIIKYNNDTKYQYYSEKNKEIFEGNGTELIDAYGTPKVYAYNGNDKELLIEPQPYKHVTVESITSIPTVDNNQYRYLNNGVSNALQFQNTMGDLNYENINQLSQYFSLQDYNWIRWIFSHKNVKDKEYYSFYNDEKNSEGALEPKKILIPGEEVTLQELDDLYDAAYEHRPKLTFDKELNGVHITSLLQTSINSIDVGWHLNFENGWYGWTFQNGKQLSLTDILRPETKEFSWKNQISKYLFQALKFKDSKKYSRSLFGTLTLDGNSLPLSDGMALGDKESLWNGATEFVFMQDGVYVLLSKYQQGYAPVLVQLPMAFLKPEYQEFYNNTATLPTVIENNEVRNKNKPNATSKDSEIDEVDLEQSDLEYLKSSTLGLGNLYNDITKTIDGYNQGIRLARFDDVRGKSPKPSAKNSKVAHGIALATDMVKLNTSVGLTDFGNNMLHITSDVFNIVNDNIKEIEKSVEKGIESGDLKLGKVADVLSVGTDFTDTYNNFNKMKSSNEEKKIKGSVSKRKTNFESSRSAHISLMSSISKVILDGFKSNPVLSTFIAAGGASVIGLLIWKITNLFSFALPQDWSDNNLLKRFRLRKKSN